MRDISSFPMRSSICNSERPPYERVTLSSPHSSRATASLRGPMGRNQAAYFGMNKVADGHDLRIRAATFCNERSRFICPCAKHFFDHRRDALLRRVVTAGNVLLRSDHAQQYIIPAVHMSSPEQIWRPLAAAVPQRASQPEVKRGVRSL